MNLSFPSGIAISGYIKNKKRWGGYAFLILFIAVSVLAAGCTNPVNQTVIYTGTPDPSLLEDMQYQSSDLPLNGSPVVPAGISVSDLSVGTLKDGNMLFRGMVTNGRSTPIPGYVIVYIEIEGADAGSDRMSYPITSPRNLPAGSSYQFFYLTTEPVNETATSYRVTVQVADQYPGV